MEGRKEGRKKGSKEGRKEESKEGRKAGSKEGRKSDRKEGRKKGCHINILLAVYLLHHRPHAFHDTPLFSNCAPAL